MDDDARPKLKAWYATVGALPAAAKVKAEIMACLDGWSSSGKFVPIKEQMAAVVQQVLREQIERMQSTSTAPTKAAVGKSAAVEAPAAASAADTSSWDQV